MSKDVYEKVKDAYEEKFGRSIIGKKKELLDNFVGVEEKPEVKDTQKLGNQISNAINYLEKSKNEIDDFRVEAESKEQWDLAEHLEEYIADIQVIIDDLTDDKTVLLYKMLFYH
jgi:uncharacterized protein YaaN involved in tellurite resistance